MKLSPSHLITSGSAASATVSRATTDYANVAARRCTPGLAHVGWRVCTVHRVRPLARCNAYTRPSCPPTTTVSPAIAGDEAYISHPPSADIGGGSAAPVVFDHRSPPVRSSTAKTAGLHAPSAPALPGKQRGRRDAGMRGVAEKHGAWMPRFNRGSLRRRNEWRGECERPRDTHDCVGQRDDPPSDQRGCLRSHGQCRDR